MTTYIRIRSLLAETVLRRDTMAGRAFDYVVYALVLSVLVIFSVNSLPDIEPADRRKLEMAETAIFLFFALEYALRIWVSGNRWRYIFSFFGIVDLLSVAPFLLGTDLLFIRSLRLLRLILILKTVRHSEAIHRLKQAWEQIKDELVIYGTASFVVLFTAAAGIYYFEHQAQPEAFKSVFHSLWWAVTTLISVEYGDVYPVTTAGKIFTFFIAIAGIGVVAVPTALLASALTAIKRSEDS